MIPETKTKIQVQDDSSLSKMQDVKIKFKSKFKLMMPRTKMKFKIAEETTFKFQNMFEQVAVNKPQFRFMREMYSLCSRCHSWAVEVPRRGSSSLFGTLAVSVCWDFLKFLLLFWAMSLQNQIGHHRCRLSSPAVHLAALEFRVITVGNNQV